MKIHLTFKTLILLLASIFFFLLIIFLFTTDFSFFDHQKPEHYDTFMTNVHAIKLDKFGKIHNELFSPKMFHYLATNTTISEKPYFIFYGNDGNPWHIRANHGKASNNNQLITLWDNVHIRQLPGPGSHQATITTSIAYLYPDRSYAETDKPVTITQPGSIIHGIGMQVDFKKGTVKIVSQTKGMFGSEDEK